ncbi:hypothetical protein D3C77_661080 [compost metagenome]
MRVRDGDDGDFHISGPEPIVQLPLPIPKIRSFTFRANDYYSSEQIVSILCIEFQ